MHSQDISEGDCLPPSLEDAAIESGVLGFVIQEHPALMTVSELELAMNGQRNKEFCRRDEVERAIRELVGTGLLHIAGGLVLPSRAALHCSILEIG